MVASAIFILDAKGKVLINRFYRGDVTARAVEQFMTLLLEGEEDGLKPIIIHEGMTYVFVKHNGLFCQNCFVLYWHYVYVDIFSSCLDSSKF